MVSESLSIYSHWHSCSLVILVLFSTGLRETTRASSDHQTIEPHNASASDAMPLPIQKTEESQVKGWNIWKSLGLPSVFPSDPQTQDNQAAKVEVGTEQNINEMCWWQL
jgi:hypothetical protein